MKTAILRELFKLIKKESMIQLKVLWIQIKIHCVIIISSIAFIISILSLILTINFQTIVNKKINDLEKKLTPEHEIIKKFDKVYFQESEMKSDIK